MASNKQIIKDTLDFKIIVARYQEDVAWLEEFAPKLAIQNKGPLTGIPESLRPCTKQLPNIGLDQYVYLDYIVSNYEALPDICLFIQANIDDHMDTFFPYLTTNHAKELDVVLPYTNTLTSRDIIYEYLKQIHLYGHTLNSKVYLRQGLPCTFPEFHIRYFHIEAPDRGCLAEYSTDLTFGQWFENYVGQPCPPANQVVWFKNGIFGVAKSFILSRPKSFYEAIQNQITKPRQDILHYIERSWFYMLNLSTFQRPHTCQSALVTYRYIFEALNNLIVASGQQLVEGSLFFYGGYDISFNEEFVHKQVNLFNLAKDAEYILEIGFNAGHSTALMLLANPRSKILHFDLNEHAYVQPCYDYLKSVFGPHRFVDFVVGDSTQTVPTFVQELHARNKDFEGFDLLHIDGGHDDHVARSDITHTATYANPSKNTVIFDDTNYENLQAIVDEAIASGLVLPRKDVLIEDFCGECHHFIGHYARQSTTAPSPSSPCSTASAKE